MIEKMPDHLDNGFDYVCFGTEGNVAGFYSEVMRIESLVKSFKSRKSEDILKWIVKS